MPKSSLFRKFGTDNLKNGIYLGMLMGITAYFGQEIVKIFNSLPQGWMVLGEYSVLFYMMGIGGIIGYYIDRK